MNSITLSSFQAWTNLFSTASIQVRTKVLEDHLPLWCHLLGAPAGLSLDASLFINEDKVRRLVIYKNLAVTLTFTRKNSTLFYNTIVTQLNEVKYLEEPVCDPG